MKNKKDKNATPEETQTRTVSSTIQYKDLSFDERLEGEIRPVLEKTLELRNANTELQGISKTVNKTDLRNIIGELQSRKRKQ